MGRVFLTIGYLLEGGIPLENRCEKCHENQRKWRVDFELTSKRYEICDKCKEVVDRWVAETKEDSKGKELFFPLPNIYPIPRDVNGELQTQEAQATRQDSSSGEVD